MSTSFALAAYETLAPDYDAFTAEHDYETWTATLEQLARAHGLTGDRLLDVACGTGKSFLPFVDRGYEVSACDLSPQMLAIAGQKAAGRARLFVADMRALPAVEPATLVTCLDDALNYLLDPDELRAALASARRCLEPSGLYVFDVNTLGAYRSTFVADVWSEVEDRLFVWRGRTNPDLQPGGTARATVETFAAAGSGRWRRSTSEHVQCHHPHERILGSLEAAGLRCLVVRGVTPDGALYPRVDEMRHTKRLYLATPRRGPDSARR